MKKIFIYGAGYYGEQVLKKVEKKFQIIGFIDSDKKKINKKFKKFKIYNPIDIKNKNFDYIYIASMWSTEIYKSLLKKNVNKKKIYIYPISKINKNMKKKKNWSKIFKDLINLFNSNYINYYLDHSSLLGITRENDIYKYGDIDLGVNFAQLPKILHILKSSKKFNKIELGIIDIKNKKFGNNFIFQITINDIIDLQIKKLINKNYLWIIGSNILKIHQNNLVKKKIISFKNIKIKIPFYYKKYLKNLYGNNWKIPASNWTYDDYTNIYEKIKFKNFRIKRL